MAENQNDAKDKHLVGGRVAPISVTSWVCTTHKERLQIAKQEDGHTVYTLDHGGRAEMTSARQCYLIDHKREIASGNTDPTGEHLVFYRRLGIRHNEVCVIVKES